MVFDEIWRAEWNRNKTARFYDKKIKKCRANKEFKNAEEWEREASSLVGDLDTNLQIMTSRILVREAHELHLPVPEYSDNQSWENIWGSYVLLPRAYAVLRSQMREERKGRRESITAIIKDIISPIGALIISILSLLIAYAALKLKH